MNGKPLSETHSQWMKYVGFVLLLCSLLLIGVNSAFARDGGTKESRAKMAQLGVQPTYVLGPEDVLTITVRDVPDFSGDYMVRLDGTISFPVVGDVMVAGLTATELEARLKAGLASELRYPQVTVNVKQMRMARIYILGSVSRPAVYDWKDGWRLTELIAAAGGLTEPPERLKAIIFREGTENEMVNLQDIFINGIDADNYVVKPGDVVNIQPQATLRVNIVGEVKDSGIKQLLIGQGAVEALGAAGGENQDAALSKATIRRGNQIIPVDLYDAVINGDAKKDLPMEDGDTLIIPQQYASIGVVGMVSRPGPQALPDGRTWTVSQAIAAAGGIGSRAKSDGIQLSMPQPDGKVKVIKGINLKLLGTKGHPDYVLHDKDVVFVPQSGALGIGDIASLGNLYYIARTIGL